MTYKQLQRQFKTWKKKNSEMYGEIEMLAEQSGILTPTGKVTRSKKNKDKLERFAKKYQKKYGSFTRHEKRQREEWKKEILEKGYEGTFREFKEKIKNEKEMKDYIDDTFRQIPSGERVKLRIELEGLNIEQQYEIAIKTREKAIEKIKEEEERLKRVTNPYELEKETGFKSDIFN